MWGHGGPRAGCLGFKMAGLGQHPAAWGDSCRLPRSRAWDASPHTPRPQPMDCFAQVNARATGEERRGCARSLLITLVTAYLERPALEGGREPDSARTAS